MVGIIPDNNTKCTTFDVVIVVAVVNLVGILPDTDIECLVVVSPGGRSRSWLLRNCSIHSRCSSENTGATSPSDYPVSLLEGWLG